MRGGFLEKGEKLKGGKEGKRQANTSKIRDSPKMTKDVVCKVQTGKLGGKEY